MATTTRASAPTAARARTPRTTSGPGHRAATVRSAYVRLRAHIASVRSVEQRDPVLVCDGRQLRCAGGARAVTDSRQAARICCTTIRRRRTCSGSTPASPGILSSRRARQRRTTRTSVARPSTYPARPRRAATSRSPSSRASPMLPTCVDTAIRTDVRSLRSTSRPSARQYGRPSSSPSTCRS